MREPAAIRGDHPGGAAVQAIDAQLYSLAVIGVLTSVIGAYYYMRIIKIMYFDEPAEAFDRPIGREIRVILGVSTLFVTLFILQPDLIVDPAAVAARVLFAG